MSGCARHIASTSMALRYDHVSQNVVYPCVNITLKYNSGKISKLLVLNCGSDKYHEPQIYATMIYFINIVLLTWQSHALTKIVIFIASYLNLYSHDHS